MEQQEILEGNKLIAQFVTDEPEVLKNDLLKAGTLESMHYHDDWNWLMPCIDKIELMEDEKYIVVIESDKCSIYEWRSTDPKILFNIMNTGEKIWSTYQCIIKFIKWHNNGKQI